MLICLPRRGGFVYQNTNLLNNAGNNGRYWSSTPSGTNAYNLNFNGDDSNINPSNGPNNQNNGMSVRCLYCARSPP